jgi:ATP-dependent Clp protease ATP-binding subunit ClpB
MLSKQAIALRVSDRAKDLLADLGYDPQYGARPMKRVLQKEVINELSKRVLSGEFGASDTIYIDADAKGLLSFRKDPFEGALALPEDGDTDEDNN